MSSLLAALSFLALNTFFVLAEFSLVRTQAARIEVMVAQGRKRAALVLRMLRNLDAYLSAIQIGVTMSTLGLGWLGEPAVSRLLVQKLSGVPLLAGSGFLASTVIAFVVIMYIQIVFAELVPRSAAIHKAEPIALWLAVPLEIYYRIFRIPTMLLSKSSIWVSRLMGFPPASEHEQVFSEQEFRLLLGTSQDKGLLPLDRLLLIENIFDFSTLKAKDAMVPRERVAFLSTERTWEDNLAVLKSNHFSRYPLGEPDLDNVTGFIHLKDLVLSTGLAPNLPAVKRRIATVGENELLPTVLKMMTRQGKHMLLVLKPNGKTSGILTLEDVLEEIVGEIHDEYDVPGAWSLNQYLTPAAIDVDFKATTPAQAIDLLAARIKAIHPDLNADAIVKAVNAREAQLPTAIGKGVAVPHARLATLKTPIIAIGRASKPVGFPAPDRIPVRLVFLILTPVSAPLEQLKILSRVAMLMNNDTLRRQVIKSKSPIQLLEVIRTSESLLAG